MVPADHTGGLAPLFVNLHAVGDIDRERESGVRADKSTSNSKPPPSWPRTMLFDRR